MSAVRYLRGFHRRLPALPIWGSLVGISLCAAVVSAVWPFSIAHATTLNPGDILVADRHAVLRVDPATGDRTIISDDATGSGPTLEWLGDIDVDVWGNIFVTDIGLTFGPVQVVQITPSTGDRRTVTSDTVGSGPQLRVPWPIAVDHDRNILVIDSNSVLRVGPETGDRSIVSGLGTGEGPSFIEPKGLAVADNGDIFVADDDDDDAPRPVILQVDPQTGDRNLVSGEGVGSGPLLGSLVELAFDDSGQLLVLAADRILRVDPITGDRELFSGDSLGSGPTGFGGIAVGYDGTVYVAAGDPSFVMRVDPATGDRIIVSANTHGSGPDFGTFGGIAIVPLLIPEPSSLALAAWCISFMACLRRHYRRLSVSVGGVIKAL